MTRHAFCHFADDLRFEVGNKVSLIGMYSGEMFVPVIPVTLPKLVAMGFCTTRADKLIESLSFKVFLGDQILQEGELPADTLRDIQAHVASGGDAGDPVREISIGVNVMLSPLHLTTLAPLKVVLIADGEELVAGKLRIHQAQMTMPSQAVNQP
jgi:hypothetical protein